MDRPARIILGQYVVHRGYAGGGLATSNLECNAGVEANKQ